MANSKKKKKQFEIEIYYKLKEDFQPVNIIQFLSYLKNQNDNAVCPIPFMNPVMSPSPPFPTSTCF